VNISDRPALGPDRGGVDRQYGGGDGHDGSFGAAELAANETTRQLVMVALTLPMGLSWAIAIRVGQAAGQREQERLRNVAQAALRLSLAGAVLTGLTIFVGRAGWVGIFLGSRGEASREVVVMAEAMVAVAAAGVAADGVVLGALGIFRGLATAQVPAAIYATGLWLVGLPLGFLWGHVRGGGGLGVWSGLVVGNVLAAVALTGLLAWRLRRSGARATA
jgi:MATE family multidrug resistance protein